MESMLDLDEKLVDLTGDYHSDKNQYEKLRCEINEMLCKKHAMDYNIANKKRLIGATLDQILNSDDFIFSRDKFTDMFIRVSYFCLRDENFSEFNYINITETQLQASNKHMLVKMTCAYIPDDVKNSKIFWNVRDWFSKHATMAVDYPNFDAVIPSVDNYQQFPGVSRGSFRNLFKCHEHNGNIITVNFAGVELAFNKEYLTTCLFVMGRKTFNLYVKGSNDLLMLQNSDTTIVLGPLMMP